MIFGLGVGIVSAVWRNRWPDHLGMTLAVSGISFPAFALGMLLMEIFSVKLGWLPVVCVPGNCGKCCRNGSRRRSRCRWRS